MKYVQGDLVGDTGPEMRAPRKQASLLATWGVVVAVALGLAWLMVRGLPTPP